MYGCAQRGLAEVILEPLGLEEDGFKLVKPIPADLDVHQKMEVRKNREKFGSVQYSSHSYKPGSLPVLDINVHLYDEQFEERFEELVSVFLERCRQGDFGDKFEPNISLLVKKDEKSTIVGARPGKERPYMDSAKRRLGELRYSLLTSASYHATKAIVKSEELKALGWFGRFFRGPLLKFEIVTALWTASELGLIERDVQAVLSDYDRMDWFALLIAVDKFGDRGPEVLGAKDWFDPDQTRLLVEIRDCLSEARQAGEA